MVGECTAPTSYYFLSLPVAPSVSCSCLDAPYTRSSKLPPSPAVSYRLPMSTTRLSLLPNPHPKTEEDFREAGGRPLMFEGIKPDDPIALQKRAALAALGCEDDPSQSDDGVGALTWIECRDDESNESMGPLLRLARLNTEVREAFQAQPPSDRAPSWGTRRGWLDPEAHSDRRPCARAASASVSEGRDCRWRRVPGAGCRVPDASEPLARFGRRGASPDAPEQLTSQSIQPTSG